MRKDILIIDWSLLLIIVLMIITKFINLPFTKIIQPIFFILILIHIIQHWKIILYSLKPKKKQ